MNKRLLVEIDGDLEEQFLSMSYTLKVENGISDKLCMPLYEMQCQENYLFEILSSCGISFIKRVSIMNYFDEKVMSKYLKENNNIIVEPVGVSQLLIENTGNLILSAKSDEIMPSGFTINMESKDETTEQTIELLSTILDEIRASYEIR